MFIVIHITHITHSTCNLQQQHSRLMRIAHVFRVILKAYANVAQKDTITLLHYITTRVIVIHYTVLIQQRTYFSSHFLPLNALKNKTKNVWKRQASMRAGLTKVKTWKRCLHCFQNNSVSRLTIIVVFQFAAKAKQKERIHCLCIYEYVLRLLEAYKCALNYRLLFYVGRFTRK